MRTRTVLVAVTIGVLGVGAGLALSTPDRGGPARPVARDTVGTPSSPDDGPTSALVPQGGILLGVWSKPPDDVWTPPSVIARFEELEELAGRRMDLVQSFHPWTEHFPGWREDWAMAGGRTPLISWDGTVTTEIAAGAHDDLIIERARALRRLDQPVLLRFMWEMNIAGKQDRVVSPDAYVAAWRHVRQLFRSEGALRVQWVWCPTAEAFDEERAARYYPGDEHVDWVCAQGYNWAGTRDGARWRSPAEIFAAADRFATSRGKPLMVGETGAVETDDPGAKARWLRQWVPDLQDGLDAVRALVYFDSDTRYPWWLDSSPSSAAAWRELAQHPVVTGHQ